MSNKSFYALVSNSFPSVRIPNGGLAHFWYLVFSGHPDICHHIAAGKVSILKLLGYLFIYEKFRKIRKYNKLRHDKPTVWAAAPSNMASLSVIRNIFQKFTY